VPVNVSISSRAKQQVRLLRRPNRKAYDEFLVDLRARGCEALRYRLTGNDLLERLCVRHLLRELRVVVAFQSSHAATILLVGPHHDDDPFLDVYAELYALAQLDRPPIRQRRKPSCCTDDGTPSTVDGELLEDLVKRARQLSGAEKRREQRLASR
jgi:hypothetical protein